MTENVGLIRNLGFGELRLVIRVPLRLGDGIPHSKLSAHINNFNKLFMGWIRNVKRLQLSLNHP